MSVVVLHQSALPSSRPPDCVSLLRRIDAIIDAFNGDHDRGDKSSLLHPRHAVWRKAYKYETEDLNDAINTFFRLCPDPSIPPDQLPRYLATVRRGLQQERPERLAAFESDLAPCLALPVPSMTDLFDTVSRHGGQLWLRAALELGLQPATPWPVFPAALAQSLRQSLSADPDMSWGRKHVLRELEGCGWAWDEAELSAQDQASIDSVRRSLLADAGITQVPAGQVRWYYDPIAGRWRTDDELLAALPGKTKCLMFDREHKVLTFYEPWTKEENYRAWDFVEKVRAGEIKLPSVPRPSTP